MEPTIRPMLKKDIQVVGNILFRSFNSVTSKYGYPPKFQNKKEGDAWAWALLRHQPVEIFIAEIEGRISGLCCLNPRGEIGGVGPVVVDPDIQGKHIGYYLMRALIEKADRIESLRLIQEAYNPASFALYHRLGFVPVACMLEMVFGGTGLVPRKMNEQVATLTQDDMDVLAGYDRPKSKSDRRVDFQYYAQWGKIFIYREGDKVRGFLACLPGPESVTFGPLVADGEAEAIALIQNAVTVFEGKVCRTRIMAGDLILAETMKKWGFRIHCINNLMVRGTWRPGANVEAFGIFPEGI